MCVPTGSLLLQHCVMNPHDLLKEQLDGGGVCMADRQTDRQRESRDKIRAN